MTVPIVTEQRLQMEPLTHDPFVDSLEDEPPAARGLLGSPRSSRENAGVNAVPHAVVASEHLRVPQH
jgi:hypothetical protein